MICIRLPFLLATDGLKIADVDGTRPKLFLWKKHSLKLRTNGWKSCKYPYFKFNFEDLSAESEFNATDVFCDLFEFVGFPWI